MRPFLLALVLTCTLSAAETQAQVEARTDMNDPEQVFALANWCRDNQRHQSAGRYYQQVLKLDKEHEGARTALGFVLVRGNWVHKSLVSPADLAQAQAATTKPGTPNAVQRSAGPAPKASEIDWQAQLPEDPTPRDTWIQQYIDRMPTVGNDSDQMEIAVATLIEKYRATGIAKLCAAMAKPDWKELYGPCRVIAELARAEGNLDQARPIFPYLMLASARATDSADLAIFCFTVPLFQDRRAIPRLIELMAHGDKEVAANATAAVAKLTRVPQKDLTPAKAQEWWNKNHALSDETVLLEQLGSADPLAQLAAAEGLIRYRSAAVVPALVKLLQHEERPVNARAAALLRRIAGNDFSYDPARPAAEKAKVAKQIEQWWKEEGAAFVWLDDRNAAPKPGDAPAKPAADPMEAVVAQLASTRGREADQAETNLRAMGEKAVPLLIKGLANGQVIVRRKCDALLREIAKRNIGFVADGDEAARSQGIEAWRAWAREQGINPDAPVAVPTSTDD